MEHRAIDDRDGRASEAEARLASLIEQAPDGIFVADLDGRYHEVNDAGCRLLGYTRDELLGMTIVDLLPADDVPRLAASRQAMLGGAIAVDEWRLRHKDGSLVPVEVSAKILPDGRWQGFVRDLSRRRRAEARADAARAELRDSEERFRLAFDDAPIGMALVALDGRFVRVNRRLCELVGYAAGELIGLTFQAITHPDDLDADLELAGQLHRGEIPRYQLAKRYVRKDGVVVDVMLHGGVMRTPGGEPLYYLAQIEDITEQRRTARALAESEVRLALAVEASGDLWWDWDLVRDDSALSPQYWQLLGYPPGSVRTGRDFFLGHIHPDDVDQVGAAMQAHLEGRTERSRLEYRMRTASGAYRWFEGLGRVTERDPRGAPLRMVGIGIDIDARKRAEQALRTSEATLAGVIGLAADGIIAVDEQQRIAIWNDGARRMFGWSADEILGRPIDLVIPERMRTADRASFARFAADDARRARMDSGGEIEIAGLRKDGTEFPISSSVSKLQLETGQLFTLVVRDVSDQVRREREQRFLAEFSAALAASLDVAETLERIAELAVRELTDCCIVDLIESSGAPRRVAVTCRDPAKADICRSLERVRPELPSLVQRTLLTGEAVHLPDITPALLAAFAQNPEHLEALRGLDPMSAIAIPMIAHGNQLGVMTFITTGRTQRHDERDLRFALELGARAALALENARLYEAARGALRVRDDVLGVVAHDLRNPLNSILMQTELLRRRGGEPERRRMQPVERIRRATSRMDRLIQDLLDVARMEAGRLSIEPTTLATSEVLHDALDSQRSLAAAAGLELCVEVDRVLPAVWADRDRLLQILENLIGNAIKYTPSGPIAVGVAPRETEVVFWVRDGGPGIPADALPHLFDRFWQVKQTGRRGAGLGLSIVKGLVEAHGGRVWVESAPGAGSTFYFTMPAQPSRRDSSPERWSAASSL